VYFTLSAKAKSAETWRNEYLILKTVKVEMWLTGYFNVASVSPKMDVNSTCYYV